MWLLNTSSHTLHSFGHEEAVPPYAILSHTWATGEVLFKDVRDLAAARLKNGWPKIESTCRQAAEDGLGWAWIDSCCIDKTSSAELSEAINSMFDWYQGSRICYVLLGDLSPGCPALRDGMGEEFTPWFLNLAECRWFGRGWCLQELLGPTHLRFFNSGWKVIGDLHDLLATISGITRIDVDVLTHLKPIVEIPVAVRMSWASHRQTTRPEDAAYALLGIFDVNMPLLYGEGRRAFVRLQEEIIRTSTDLSIFAWQVESKHHDSVIANQALLASSPAAFSRCSNGKMIKPANMKPVSFAMTNAGLQMCAPLVPMPNSGSKKGLLLNYYNPNHPGLISVLPIYEDGSDGRYRVAPNPKIAKDVCFRLSTVSIQAIATAVAEPITIARDPLLKKPVKPSKITYVLRVAHGCPIQVVDMHPQNEWNTLTKTWAPSRFGPEMSTAIALCRHKYGQTFTVGLHVRHAASRSKRVTAGFLKAGNMDDARDETRVMNDQFHLDAERGFSPHHLQISVPLVSGLRGPRIILISLKGGPYAADGIDGNEVTFHSEGIDRRKLTNRFATK